MIVSQCWCFFHEGGATRVEVSGPSLSDGSTSFPPGSTLTFILCDHKNNCCSEDFSGALTIDSSFPPNHPCKSIVISWSELFAGRAKIEFELTGTNLVFSSPWMRVYFDVSDMWIYCNLRDVQGGIGPVLMDWCAIEMRFWLQFRKGNNIVCAKLYIIQVYIDKEKKAVIMKASWLIVNFSPAA